MVKALVTAAEMTFCFNIFLKRLDISCKLSVRKMIHMKYQALFSPKTKQ